MNSFAIVKNRGRGKRLGQRGVSLIETICTMTILGGISATAVPMVAELPSQARASVVEHMAGALQSASNLSHMKCAVTPGCNMSGGEAVVSVEGGEVKLLRGYPQGGDAAGIESAMSYEGFSTVQDGRATVFQKTGALQAQDCAVRYEAPGIDGGRPVINAVTTGC